MLEYLKDLLNDIKISEYKNKKQKILALETAIEILEKYK